MKELNYFIGKFIDMMHEIDASFDYSSLSAETNLEDIEGWSSLAAVFLVTMVDEEFSKEFGDNTDEYYLNITHPYVTEDDGVLRDENGDEIIYEDEPAGIGFLDAIPESKLLWFMNNFDAVMDPDGTFTIVFDRDKIVPIK